MKLRLILLTITLAGLSFSQPITGEAQNLEFVKDRVIYKGDVKLVRGEAVLRADEVVIFVDEKGKPVKLVATGRVRYTETSKRAYSDYAEYDLLKELIFLRGAAKVEEGGNLLEADEILYDKKNNTLKAKGNNGKVRTIYVEEERNEKVRHSERGSQQEKNVPEKGKDNR